eukprot:TRINITY_DN21713_c0_g1_i1.p1 TRINITY_DN21713_c0_g1~~TRINITY_DN21713_c0_g1_i1.p1  ORF type:complete len:703 (+),score=82.43 TRINITY_DN21713_c0_g1_i1:53-2161(+)
MLSYVCILLCCCVRCCMSTRDPEERRRSTAGSQLSVDVPSPSFAQDEVPSSTLSIIGEWLNEAVFEVGSIVRAHEQFNKRFTHISHDMLRWIDRAGMGKLPDDLIASEERGKTVRAVRHQLLVHEFHKLAFVDTAHNRTNRFDKQLNASKIHIATDHLPPASNFLHLAQLAATQLRTQWPTAQHRAWYHGVEDGWLVWVMMMFDEFIEASGCASEEDVLSEKHGCAHRNPPIVDLEATDMKTSFLWYGVSGSDDLLWVCLALFSEFRRYYPAQYSLNGRRGIEELFVEVQKRFEGEAGSGEADMTNVSRKHRHGRHLVLLDWGTNRNYVATIGLSLMAQVSAGVAAHTDVVPQKTRMLALRNAEDVLATLHATGMISHAHVYDGFKHDSRTKRLELASFESLNTSSIFEPREIDQSEWSYNAGAAVGALTALYRATGNYSHLADAERLVRSSLRRFTQTVVPENASQQSFDLLGEIASAKLDRDQLAFKGVFLYFLGDFVRTYRCDSGSKDLPDWMQELYVKLANQAQNLIQHRLSPERGGFCGYWGESQAEWTCAEQWTDPRAAVYGPLSMMSASQLFLVAYLLGAEQSVFRGSFCGNPPATANPDTGAAGSEPHRWLLQRAVQSLRGSESYEAGGSQDAVMSFANLSGLLGLPFVSVLVVALALAHCLFGRPSSEETVGKQERIGKPLRKPYAVLFRVRT